MVEFELQPINWRHNRESFTCATGGMDDFLIESGLSSAEGSTWVLVPRSDTTEIVAYLTFAPDPNYFEGDEDGWEEAEDAWEVIELKRIAVASKYQGQGIGQQLVYRVFEKVVHAAEKRDIRFLVTEPLNYPDPNQRKRLQQFYLNLGFKPSPPAGKYYAIHIDTLRAGFGYARSGLPFEWVWGEQADRQRRGR